MRVFVLSVSALLVLGIAGCRQPRTEPRPYVYRSSAFSENPGKAWSGNAAAMLRDMDETLILEEIAARPLQNGLGFQKGRALLVQLRPLGPEGESGTGMYALETTAADHPAPVRIHEAIADTLTRKHTPYAVTRP